MRILGIETSCDETAIALIETDTQNNISALSNSIHSQIDIHKEYGGVYPSLAKREHAKNLVPLLIKVLDENNFLQANTDPQTLNYQDFFEREPELAQSFNEILKYRKPPIDLITVTEGPGLEPALWVGINFARALSQAWQIPMLPINHMEGHIMSVLTLNKNIKTPAIALLISGGHTQLVLVEQIGKYKIIGETKDDAVGEAFDKVARILGLPYPGGPQISLLAEEARQNNLANSEFKCPRPMLNSPDYDFSFSGLKTAVLYMVKKMEAEKPLDDLTKKIIAREFEDAVTDVLVKKTKRALDDFITNNLIVGGGVIANKNIREQLEKIGANLFLPDKQAITDNALMIAIAGFYKSKNVSGEIAPIITAKGNLKLS